MVFHIGFQSKQSFQWNLIVSNNIDMAPPTIISLKLAYIWQMELLMMDAEDDGHTSFTIDHSDYAVLRRAKIL